MSIRIDGTNTTANPGITGADTDTGLQFGTNEVKVVTGGSDRVTVDSSGQCGIGTSVPSELLHIAGATNPAITLQDTTNNTDARIKTNNNGDLVFEADYNNEQGDTRIGFELDGSEKVRVDSSGRVGIGETSMDGLLVIKGDSNDTSMPSIRLKDGTDSREAWISNSSGDLVLVNGGDDNTPHCKITMFDGNIMTFATANTERMRISDAGDVKFGMGNFADSGVQNNSTNDGVYIDAAGDTKLQVARSGGVPFAVNRIGSDGTLVDFYQQGSVEGSITVSGSTVSYGGGHLSRWSQLAGNAERTEILRGSVLSNLDEMCEWAHAAQDAVLYTEEDELPEGASVGDVKTPAVDAYTEDNEQLNRMKVSDVEGDVNVSGVFQAWDDDDDTYTNDFYCAMTGDFVIRIAQGTTVARGDLLMSAGDGTAKPQDDDIVRSKTIAKVTSTTVSTTYSDGSYCVPCVLMAC